MAMSAVVLCFCSIRAWILLVFPEGLMFASGTHHRMICQQSARVVTVYFVIMGIVTFLNHSAKDPLIKHLMEKKERIRNLECF